MSQPDTLLDDLERVQFWAKEEPKEIGQILNRTEAEIIRLRAELATLRTIGFNDLARHEAELATVQAQATTYWDALDEVEKLLAFHEGSEERTNEKPGAEFVIIINAGDFGDILKATRDALGTGQRTRAALAKPTT